MFYSVCLEVVVIKFNARINKLPQKSPHTSLILNFMQIRKLLNLSCFVFWTHLGKGSKPCETYLQTVLIKKVTGKIQNLTWNGGQEKKSKITLSQNSALEFVEFFSYWKSESFENTFYKNTTREALSLHNFFSWRWTGSFLSRNFRKGEGIQKSMQNFVSWLSTSTSPHPCVGEIVHTAGWRLGIEATLHKKFCWATPKVSPTFFKKQQFWHLISPQQICKDLDFRTNSKTTSSVEKVSTQLPSTWNPS